MKKFFVSLVVIVTFVSYSLYQRLFDVQPILVIAPKNISNIPQNIPSNTPTLIPVPTSTPISTQSSPLKTLPSSIPTSVPQTLTPTPKSGYRDGNYIGNPIDAFYGNIQVQATISNGRITNIQFLQYPNDRSTSIEINSQADPMLAREAIAAQSANVDIISGATDSSQAFIQSLQSALNKAKI